MLVIKDARELLHDITSGQNHAVVDYMDILSNKQENKEVDWSTWLCT